MLLHVLQLTYLYFVLVSRAYAQDVESYSPPSYPSPWMKEDGEWAEAYTKARAFVSQLTLLEKVNLTTGVGYTVLVTESDYKLMATESEPQDVSATQAPSLASTTLECA